MGDEDKMLADAAKLPWEERFVHTSWKARVAAYERVIEECKTADDVVTSPCLKYFGE